MKTQLQWAGHVVRMPVSRIPKLLLYRQLKERERGLGRPLLRYKNKLKANLKSCNTEEEAWENMAVHRERWSHQDVQGIETFKQAKVASIQDNRNHRKG